MTNQSAPIIRVNTLQPPVSRRNLKDIVYLAAEGTKRQLDPDAVMQTVEGIVDPDNPNQDLYIAKHAGRIVGMATLTKEFIVPNEHNASISGLAARNEYGQSYIVRRLLEPIVALADEDGLELHWQSKVRNSRLVFLFEKTLGFDHKNTNLFVRDSRG